MEEARDSPRDSSVPAKFEDSYKFRVLIFYGMPGFITDKFCKYKIVHRARGSQMCRVTHVIFISVSSGGLTWQTPSSNKWQRKVQTSFSHGKQPLYLRQ